MSDTITVRFGEREVVFRRYHQWYRTYLGKLIGFVDLFPPNRLEKRFQINAHVPEYGDSAQAAADALYAKLLAHRDELNRLIGGES